MVSKALRLDGFTKEAGVDRENRRDKGWAPGQASLSQEEEENAENEFEKK